MFQLQVSDEITLRLVQPSDAPELLTLFENNRQHLTEWQDWPNKIQTLADCEAYIARHLQEYDNGKTLPAVIIVDDTTVGWCTLTHIVTLLRKAEISYWIDEGYQGRGIVTRSCRALLKHAYEEMHLNRIQLKFKRVDDDNENFRSRRVAMRLGFTVEGILRQEGMTGGVLMDMVITSLLADEWHGM